MVNQRKRNIVTKLCECFGKYNQVVIVSLDNVSTNQIHAARKILNEGQHKGEMIIGKNSLIRKALKFVTEAPNTASADYDDHKEWTQNAKLECLRDLMVLNVGLIFSEEPYNELRTKIEAQKISMPARTGVMSPCNVVIPAGPTGVEVGKIDLFHKLNIQCKTVKSAIEISKEVRIITKGEKVTEGAVQLCKLLQIVPFEYSLTFQKVYIDGVVIDQDIIEMPMSEVTASFEKFAGYLTAVSMGANIPNALSVPQFIANAFKTCLAIGSESGYSFKQLEDAMNAASNVAATTTVAADTKVTAKKEEKAESVEEESEDMDMGGMFD
jgi:large subunit ribosomal protein LP0